MSEAQKQGPHKLLWMLWFDEKSISTIVYVVVMWTGLDMSFLFIVMSDIGLPDFSGQDLGIDLDKGIFVRKGKKSDNDSNDSGNNSMNTNGSGKI